mgnify:CR=1 FL=1
MSLLIRLILLLALTPLATLAGQSGDGIANKEIVVGSLQDLSGPIATLGAHFRNGTQMRFDEENAKGGIHGRRLRLVIEDTGYDPKRAILAAQKLIQRDRVFAVIHNLGSPVVMSTLPLFLDAGILHLFPAAPLKEVYEPVHRLKFAMSPSYAVSVPPALLQITTAWQRRVTPPPMANAEH